MLLSYAHHDRWGLVRPIAEYSKATTYIEPGHTPGATSIFFEDSGDDGRVCRCIRFKSAVALGRSGAGSRGKRGARLTMSGLSRLPPVDEDTPKERETWFSSGNGEAGDPVRSTDVRSAMKVGWIAPTSSAYQSKPSPS